MIKFRVKEEPQQVKDEDLIRLVKEHEFLYNPKNCDYRNLPQRSVVWSAIAKELGIKDQTVVQKRWKVVREKFSVAYRKFIQDDAQSSWDLYDRCTFLIPYVNSKPDNKKDDQSFSLIDTSIERRLPKSPFDETQLTQLVKERPVLYDKQHEEFRGGSQRKKAWMEIANITGWDEDTLQKRWRVMRDRFVRELRRTKNSDGDPQVSCSAFFRDMLFLARHVKSKKYEVETTDALSDISQDWDTTIENKQEVETCVIPDATDSQQVIEEAGNVVTYSIEDGSQPQYLECYDNREEADQTELYEESSDGEPAEDYFEEEEQIENEEHHLQSQEVIAVQEIPQNHWYDVKIETPKKRNISCVLREEPPAKVRSESPDASLSESRNRMSDANDVNDEDMAFGQTIGLMLKKIPAHLKTSAKLKIFESLAKFEAEHKYIS